MAALNLNRNVLMIPVTEQTMMIYLDIEHRQSHERIYHQQSLFLGLILSLQSANGRRRCKVTPSLIGWA